MKCDSLIDIMCKQLKGRNKSETPQLYRVMCLFDKNYNKWYICEDNSKLWHFEYPKGKYLVLDQMIEEDKLFQTYEDVIPSNEHYWNIYFGFVLKDACHIMSVRDLLHTKQ